MEQCSGPATLPDLKALILALNQYEDEYLLIGGYALFAHGYHRATTDVDLLVLATRQAGERIKAAPMVLPDQSAQDIDPAWFVEGENIRVADAFVVDIMLNTCGVTYETLKPFAKTIDLDGLPIRTVNLEGLLRTKQTMRDNRGLAARSLDDLFWPTTSLRQAVGYNPASAATQASAVGLMTSRIGSG